MHGGAKRGEPWRLFSSFLNFVTRRFRVISRFSSFAGVGVELQLALEGVRGVPTDLQFVPSFLSFTFTFTFAFTSLHHHFITANMPHALAAPSASPFDLSGRTAIVTGSSTGNGRAIAVSLSQAGADVVCVDLSPLQPKVRLLPPSLRAHC